ncbi:DUF1904 family protein [Vagococcus coleopterorum]|uniref:DUF1904 family protein n=1 Tax=Vagococcus coleopterorum TaxID=2714946 RepID=A0A6G8AP48_9ENTE|nr:DUF1904 family protein [Vagococcus coleopterorum]QIL46705.1 DUF1904 family protein [Vagococcus coleopterorum]
MPRFIFKNVEFEDVKSLSQTLSVKSAEIIDCPIDWITFEHVSNTIFLEGNDITSSMLFLEVSWFKRSQEVQDQLATYLNSTLNKYFNEEKEITIIFHTLEEANYYEEGQNFL